MGEKEKSGRKASKRSYLFPLGDKLILDKVVGIDTELQGLRNHLREYNAHLEALENGDTFVPTLTGKGVSGKGSSGKKRKNYRKGKTGSPKRRRSGLSDDDDDDFFVSDDDSSTAESIDSDDESDSDHDEDFGSDTEDVGVDEDQETEDSLKEKIKESKDAIKDARERLSSARKQKKDASDHLSILSKNLAKVQREKNAFCSLKRSEVSSSIILASNDITSFQFSRDVLKEDFRVGLKDLDGTCNMSNFPKLLADTFQTLLPKSVIQKTLIPTRTFEVEDICSL